MPAIDYDLAAYADPLSVLRGGAAAAGPGCGRACCSTCSGYYLLIAPLVLVLRAWLGRRGGEWTRLFAGCLLAYVVLGGVGAAVLAAPPRGCWPPTPPPPARQRQTLEALYRTLFDTVYGGIWNIFEELLAGRGLAGLRAGCSGASGRSSAS